MRYSSLAGPKAGHKPGETSGQGARRGVGNGFSGVAAQGRQPARRGTCRSGSLPGSQMCHLVYF